MINDDLDNSNSFIIKHIDHIDVASNEIITKTSINRNYIKLLDNDLALAKNSDNIYENMFRIMPYVEGYSYKKYDLVWFVEKYNTQDDDGYIHHNVDNIYLLQSLKNNNKSFPKYSIVDHVPTFNDSDWKNINPLGSIFYGSGKFTDLSTFVTDYVKDVFLEMHEKDSYFHRFGILSSLNCVKDKILSTSFTNGNPHRERIFFPTYTLKLEADQTIMDGYCRKWDNGLLEYDITYKLGDTAELTGTYNNGVVFSSKILSSNSIDVKCKDELDESEETLDEYNENEKYFLSKDDFSIFKVKGNNEISDDDGILQTNLHPRVNSFSGTINFPVKFKDLNYMVFNSNSPSNRFGKNDTGNLNVNTITYINKTIKSITALNIISTYRANKNSKVGLMNNKFHCQIIGRWK